MKTNTHHSENGWNWKSDLIDKEDKRVWWWQLFTKLLFQAIVLAIGIAAVTGFIVEISSVF